MKPQPSLLILSAVAAAGALLLGCEGGITQIESGVSSESELIAAYVDPITPTPGGLRPADRGDLDKLPIVDGDPQDREWSAATPLFVYVTGDQALGGPGFYVELRAIWSDDGRSADSTSTNLLLKNFLYLMVRYADETFDIFPDYWRYARPGQLGFINSPTPEGMCDDVILRSENWFLENPDSEEDQVSIMFEIEPASDSRGTFAELGCQIACHSGQFGVVPQGKLDVWTWRAGRTNYQESSVYPDFSQLDPDGDGIPPTSFETADPEPAWPAYMEDMFADVNGLQHDSADRTYPPASNGYTGQLYTRNEKVSPIDGGLIPGYITEKVSVVRPGTGGQEEEIEPVNHALPAAFVLWGPTAQQFDACDINATSRPAAQTKKWSEGVPSGDTDVMPGYTIFIPNGSAADVRAKGQFRENPLKRFPIWAVEIRRPMVTGPNYRVSRPDDVSIDPNGEYTFAIAIFNRSSQIHSGSGPLRLKFAPSLYARKPGGTQGS